VEEAAYRAALPRQVRQDAAAKNLTTFLVEVAEYGDSWTMTVPEIPWLAPPGPHEDLWANQFEVSEVTPQEEGGYKATVRPLPQSGPRFLYRPRAPGPIEGG
jgi:hypothetical protein